MSGRSTSSAVPASLVDLTASEVAVAVRTCQVSATEVIDAYAQQIERINPSLNALVTLRIAEARAEAISIDRKHHEEESRVLLGVPFTVKDIIATAGTRTTCGSRILAHYVPAVDATVVARLKKAGAILIGKSNCSEFALEPQSDNLLFGPTRNPWDMNRTPGGSSGGESAAVAARCSALGVGTDFGGSLRFPAHCTGIATIRPTVGLVPSTGTLPTLSSLEPAPPNSLGFQGLLQVIGPLARSVDDLILALGVMSGPDRFDAHAVPVPLGDPASVHVRELTFAWCEGEGSYPVRSDIITAVEAVANYLSSQGLRIVHRRPPGLEEAETIYACIRAMDGLEEVCATVGDHVEVTTLWIQGLLNSRRSDTVPALLHANVARDCLRSELIDFMADFPVLLMPVAALPAFPLGQRVFNVDGLDLPYIQVGASCRAISLFGFPAAVVPCGLSHDGLPIGIQIVCPPFMDHVALAVGAFLERELGLLPAPRPTRLATISPHTE